MQLILSFITIIYWIPFYVPFHIFTYSNLFFVLKSSVFSIHLKHNNLILSNITITYWISFYDSFPHIFFFNHSFVFSIHLKHNANNIIIYHNHLLNSFFMFLSTYSHIQIFFRVKIFCVFNPHKLNSA